jgi:predicted metal-dependent enzyme (double-stranded beta helix superfamily)
MTSLAVPSPVRSDTQRRNDSLAGADTSSPLRHSHRTLAAIVERLAADVEIWRPLLHFDSDRRWYTRLQAGDGWEAWLLTWLPGQGTDLHDHGGSGGAFTALEGRLQELVPAPTGADPIRMASRTLRSPQIRAFGPSHIHQVINRGDTPAASLHVYGPALSVMNRYELHPERGPVIAVTERAGLDW